MKALLRFFLFCNLLVSFSNGLYAQVKPMPIDAILKQAYKKASKENKQVMLIFKASWNPYCSLEDSILNDPDCHKLITSQYIISVVTIDENVEHKNLENPGANEYRDNYEEKDKSDRLIPFVAILDKNGKTLAHFAGYPTDEESITKFGALLKKTSSLDDREITVIKNRFVDRFKQVSALTADTILQKAYKQASLENKKVFVIFHASWCHWCHVLDTAMNDPQCKKFFDDNYVICHLVIREDPKKIFLENPGATEIFNKYVGNEPGIPFSIIYDKDGKALGTFDGYPAFEDGFSDFKKLLKKTSSITDEQFAVIKNKFSIIYKRQLPH